MTYLIASPKRPRLRRETNNHIEDVVPEQTPEDILGKIPPPQKGPQEKFLKSTADIAIYGGAAYAGKTYAILLDFARFIDKSDYRAVIFRRTSPQITNEGGLMDTAGDIYTTHLGAKPVLGVHEYRFPSEATIRFAHLQYEKDKFTWQGAQLDRIGWDEITHFTFTQFMYLLSRTRSPKGIKTMIRATCNPDPDSWLICDKGVWGKGLIGWWIDHDTGFPIPERSGVIRWMFRFKDEYIWADSWEELYKSYPDLVAPPGTVKITKKTKIIPKSVTFIPGNIYDNELGLDADPAYLGNLQLQNDIDKAALLEGNWKVQALPGKVFNRGWFKIVETAPAGGVTFRCYDFASTAKDFAKEDSFWSASVKGKVVGGKLYILDVSAELYGAAEADDWMKDQATVDGKRCRIRWEMEGGSAGPKLAKFIKDMLKGFNAKAIRPRGDKLSRAKPAATDAKRGNIILVKGDWNNRFLGCVHKFDGSSVPLVTDVTDAFSLLWEQTHKNSGIDSW